MCENKVSEGIFDGVKKRKVLGGLIKNIGWALWELRMEAGLEKSGGGTEK